MATALEAATQLAESPFAPELVQVVGRHDDAYGRSLYVVRDEQQARVRVLSPLELRAGGQYLTQSLRRPVALAPAPLFNTFAECAEVVARLREILRTRAYERFPAQKTLFT